MLARAVGALRGGARRRHPGGGDPGGRPRRGPSPADLTPAGRLLVPEAPTLPAPVAALFGTATPLQLLTERLARARGTNPDPIRRDDPRYQAAADAADG